MKVCHITTVHINNDVRIFQKECVSLVRAGFEVHLVAPADRDFTDQGVFVHALRRTNKFGRLGRMLLDVNQAYKLAKAVDADLYHFHDPELLRIALRLKHGGKRVVYDTHEDLPRQIMGKHWIPPSLRKLLAAVVERYEDRIASKISGVVAATSFIGKRFLRVNKNTVTVNNYPVIDAIEFEGGFSTKETAKNICYTGGISVIRGAREMLDALKLIEGVKLEIAGSCSPESYLAELQAHEAWSKVIYHGLLSRRELGRLYRNARVGLVLFLPFPNHVNAQPNKLFEYMSQGIPVVASNFDLWREIVEGGECGICVDPNSPADIAYAVKRILTDDALYQKFSENGQAMVKERFNWANEEKVLIRFYSKCLSNEGM